MLLLSPGAAASAVESELPGVLERGLSGALERELSGALERELSGVLERELSGALEREFGALKRELSGPLERELSGAMERELSGMLEPHVLCRLPPLTVRERPLLEACVRRCAESSAELDMLPSETEGEFACCFFPRVLCIAPLALPPRPRLVQALSP